MRISEKMLKSKIEYLNELTNSPLTPYTRIENKLRANIGNYHLSGAYGGVCVHRMSSEGGAVNTPIVYGHVPKKELWEKLCSFIQGIEYGMNMK